MPVNNTADKTEANITFNNYNYYKHMFRKFIWNETIVYRPDVLPQGGRRIFAGGDEVGGQQSRWTCVWG